MGRVRENLYVRLFSAGSAQRDRLEDFLTEAVADLLDRLPDPDKVAFCAEVLLASDEMYERRWTEFVASRKLRWESQHTIFVPDVPTAKRPDLVLFDVSGGVELPILVVESKINAPCLDDQLKPYDGWLADKTRDHAPFTAPLVLLTHLTQPPEAFVSADGYACKTFVSRWPKVYEWLSANLAEGSWPVGCAVLAEELLGFLKEKDLMTENPTLKDFAAARLYLSGGSGSRVAWAVNGARQVVAKKFSNLSGLPRDAPRTTSWEKSGWVYDYGEFPDGHHVEWGTFFLDEDDLADWAGYEPKVTFLEGAYVLVQLSQIVKRPPSGFSDWYFPNELNEKGLFDVFCLAPFGSFKGAFADLFPRWAADRLEEGKQLIAAARR